MPKYFIFETIINITNYWISAFSWVVLVVLVSCGCYAKSPPTWSLETIDTYFLTLLQARSLHSVLSRNQGVAAWAPSRGSGAESVLCLFKLLVTVSIPWLVAPPLHSLSCLPTSPPWCQTLLCCDPLIPRSQVNHMWGNVHKFQEGGPNVFEDIFQSAAVVLRNHDGMCVCDFVLILYFAGLVLNLL